MKYFRSSLYILVFSLLLHSCDKEIKLNLPEYASKIVVNGELNSNANIKVEISRSVPILGVTDSSGYLLTDAGVKLYENNTFIGNMNYFNGFFTLPYKPVQGKNYKIEVSRVDFPSAFAIISIPEKIASSSTYIDSVGKDKSGFPLGQLTVNFKDNASTNNYYEFSIRVYDAAIHTWFPLDFNSDDVVFLNNKKLDNGAYLFSDISFNGQTKSISIPIPFGTVNGTPRFEISIKTFTEEYYRYLQQLRDYKDRSTFWSADPIILKSNVTNGLGMVGGVYNVKDTLF